MMVPAVQLIRLAKKFADCKNKPQKKIWLNLITTIPLSRLIEHLEPKNSLQQDQNDQTNPVEKDNQHEIHKLGEEMKAENIQAKCQIFLKKYKNYKLRNTSNKKRRRTSGPCATTTASSSGTSCAAGPTDSTSISSTS